MTKSFLFSLLFSLIGYSAFSQVLSKTEYFQQQVNYKIDVELAEHSKVLHGFIQIQYINNSPNSLDFIMFHLWPNAYKNTNTALAKQLLRNGSADIYWDDDNLKGFIDSLSFKSNDISLKFEIDPVYEDIGKLYLEKALLPGDTILISTPFRVKIPSAKYSRLGYDSYAYKKYSFMISQWFPKPAVYDEKGWHAMPYLNQGEFYSEFGNFEVNIVLPQVLKIASAGSFVSREIVKLNFDEGNNSDGFKHRFVLNNAHDFAWFAANDYESKSREIVLESGKIVNLQVFFLPENRQEWNSALKYVERGVRFYSEKIGEYPYDVCTAVDGSLTAGGGMEYPTITVIGDMNNPFLLESTIIHEIGHNWFYGILGFNERDYAWMDEGLNTYYQSLYEDKYFKGISLLEYYQGEINPQLKIFDVRLNDQYFYSWLFVARKNLAQPLSYSSNEFSSTNYGISAYYKPAMMFRHLRNYLGASEMDSLVSGFYSEWKFKHPQPSDLSTYFKVNASKPVDWFFDDYLLSNNYIDYKIKKVSKTNDVLRVKVKNVGTQPAPVSISSLSESGEKLETFSLNQNDKNQWISFKRDQVHTIKIDADDQMLDFNRNNNQAKITSLFPAMSKKAVRFLYSKPFNGVDALLLSPAFGWNSSNQFMIGIAAYNDPVFERKWEYQFVPLYSAVNQSINGELAVFKNFYLKGLFRKVSVGGTARKYDYDSYYVSIVNPKTKSNLAFYRLVSQADFFLKTPSNNPKRQQKISLRQIHVAKELLFYPFCGTPPSLPFRDYLYYSIWELSYNYLHRRAINPFGIELKFQANGEIVKGQITVNHVFSYNEKKRLNIRLFAGNFFLAKPNLVDYSFKMSGWSGTDDYLFNHTYLGRNETVGSGIWSAQMEMEDGGFSIPSPLGRSWTWLTAINLTSHLPLTNFVHAFANLGFYPNAINNKVELIYETGVKLTFIDRYFEIYLPIFYSQSISDVAALNNRPFYEQKIRFTFRLDMANPTKWLREIDI
jgi:hypothetical protein